MFSSPRVALFPFLCFFFYTFFLSESASFLLVNEPYDIRRESLISLSVFFLLFLCVALYIAHSQFAHKCWSVGDARFELLLSTVLYTSFPRYIVSS